LKHFSPESTRVYVLRIPYAKVEKDIRWEDLLAAVYGERGGEGMFPHLYKGGRLGSAEIESIEVWETTWMGGGIDPSTSLACLLGTL